MSEGEEVKKRMEAELKEKIKKMEKELENSTTKTAGKHCCKYIYMYKLELVVGCLDRFFWST